MQLSFCRSPSGFVVMDLTGLDEVQRAFLVRRLSVAGGLPEDVEVVAFYVHGRETPAELVVKAWAHPPQSKTAEGLTERLREFHGSQAETDDHLLALDPTLVHLSDADVDRIVNTKRFGEYLERHNLLRRVGPDRPR